MEENNRDIPVLLESGDLRIQVTYSYKRLTWSGLSSSLAQVSPVWKEMLNPPCPKLTSNEGDGDDDAKRDKQIDLSEDYGEALLILLRIAHCQFSMLPLDLEFETILEMAVLCHKYDCVGLVQPWLELWLVNEGRECVDPGHEDWLFIAWVFGREKIFQTLARKLLREMKIGDNGEGLTATGESFPGLMPPYIIESMMIIRQETIKDLLKVTYDYFDPFFRDGASVCCHSNSNNDYIDLFFGEGASVCCQPNSNEACDALMCGSLIIGLQELGLWPQKSFDTIDLSIQDLASKLESLVIWDNPANNFANHYNCGSAGFSDQIAATLHSIPDPVLEIHREHMRSQGLSRGLAIVPSARDHKYMGLDREL